MISTLRRRSSLAAGVAVLAIGLAACGTDADTADEAPEATESSEEMTDDEMDDMADEDMEDDMAEDDMESALTLQPVGEACSAIDPDGEGSSEGMADDPVATAASNNPLLTQLVGAVGATELGDTLNGLEAATVFAPYDPAFEAIADTVETLSVEQIAGVLTLHVIPENLTLEDLEAGGTFTTVNGEELTLDFSNGVEDGLPTVSASNTANVLCGNIQTANATVHLVDTVLLPTG